MKKILTLILVFVFITGCTKDIKEPISDKKDVYLTDMYTSCISKLTQQYVRNDTFTDENCSEVINFLAYSYNTTDKTTVEIVWVHNNKVIYQTKTTDDLSTNPYISSSYIEPSTGYLKGDYKIEIYIDDIYYKTINFKFE